MKLQTIIKSYGVIKAAIIQLNLENNKYDDIKEAIDVLADHRPLVLRELYNNSLNNSNIYSANIESLLLIKQRLSH